MSRPITTAQQSADGGFSGPAFLTNVEHLEIRFGIEPWHLAETLWFPEIRRMEATTISIAKAKLFMLAIAMISWNFLTSHDYYYFL